MTYRTFIRSCRNRNESLPAGKMIVERGLSYDNARSRCEAYNKARTSRQKQKGTKLEFESE